MMIAFQKKRTQILALQLYLRCPKFHELVNLDVDQYSMLKRAYAETIFNVYPINRSSARYLFLEKGVLKIYSKFTGENPCQIALKLY